MNKPAYKIRFKDLAFFSGAKRYAKSASKVKVSSRLAQMDSERFRIVTGNIKYKKIIKNHLKS